MDDPVVFNTYDPGAVRRDKLNKMSKQFADGVGEIGEVADRVADDAAAAEQARQDAEGFKNQAEVAATNAANDVRSELEDVRDETEGFRDETAQYKADFEAAFGGLSYLAPVEYGSGIEIDSAVKTVEYDGEVYAPLPSEVPFTTSGTFETDKFRLILGVTGSDLASTDPGKGAAMVGFRQEGDGTVPRPLSEKLSDVISVRDFGAVGDGVADDTTSIQDAINYAANVGATLYVPTGVYMIDANRNAPHPRRKYGLDARSGLHLRLAPDAVLKAIPNDDESYGILRIQDVSNVVVEGGRFQGEKLQHTGTTGEWGHCVFVWGSHNIILRDCILSDAWGDGLHIRCPDGVANILLDNISILDCRRHEITVNSVDGLRILGCTLSKSNDSTDGVHNVSYGGMNIDIEPNHDYEIVSNIYVFGSSFRNGVSTCLGGLMPGRGNLDAQQLYRCIVDTCTFRDGTIGVKWQNPVESSITNCRFINHWSTSEGEAVQINTCRDIVIANNTVIACRRGINIVEGEGSQSSGVSITGNVIRGDDGIRRGVSAVNCRRLSISGNEISGIPIANEAGCVILRGCSDVSVAGNVMADSERAVSIQAGCEDVSVNGNTFKDIAQYSVMGVGGVRVLVQGNKFYSSQSITRFIRIYEGVDSWTISNNQFRKDAGATINYCVQNAGPADTLLIGNDFLGASSTMVNGAVVSHVNRLPDGTLEGG